MTYMRTSGIVFQSRPQSLARMNVCFGTLTGSMTTGGGGVRSRIKCAIPNHTMTIASMKAPHVS